MASWRKDKRKTAERGYGGRWQRERIAFLSANPLCVMCLAENRVEPATVVDHIDPHRGDQDVFWDMSRWQSLCTRHHNSDKKMLETSGKRRPKIGLDGWPEE